jgi:hypothetical protein
MYSALLQGVDPTPLTDKLSEQVYVVFILALLIVVPLVGSVLGMAYAMLRAQNNQTNASREQTDNLIKAFATEGKQQRDQAKEEADKQRAHNEAMLDKKEIAFYQRFDLLNKQYDRSIESITSTQTRASESITANITTGIDKIITIQRLSDEAHNQHLEGIKTMLNQTGDKLERMIGVVHDTKEIVQAIRSDNKAISEQLDRIEVTMDAILQTVERGLEDTQPVEPTEN